MSLRNPTANRPWQHVPEDDLQHLPIDKAHHLLGWQPRWRAPARMGTGS